MNGLRIYKNSQSIRQIENAVDETVFLLQSNIIYCFIFMYLMFMIFRI